MDHLIRDQGRPRRLAWVIFLAWLSGPSFLLYHQFIQDSAYGSGIGISTGQRGWILLAGINGRRGDGMRHEESVEECFFLLRLSGPSCVINPARKLQKDMDIYYLSKISTFYYDYC